MRVKLFFGLVLMAGITVGCLDDNITGTRPLTMALTVEPESAAVAEVVTTRYSATGTGLIGIIVNWGDGVVDSVSLSGVAVSASGPVEHQYATEGTYEIVGTAEAQNGVISSEATVLIR